jgi:two-component system phosphate regulon sensor histidine kinase PhoR
VFGSDGKIMNFVAVKRDVTYEKILQKARDYFTAVTSHELRTPVTKLQLAKMMAAEFGEKMDEPEKMDQMLSILDDSFNGLQRILSTTTMLSDLNLPQVKKDLHPVFLYTDLTTCIESASSFIKIIGRDVKLKLNIDDFPKDIKINGNQEMIMKAFDGILSNAVKYTPDKKNIEVAANIKNGNAVVEISDEGIGIPKEKMELIFEPYFSLENHLKHFTSEYAFKGGGLGLGLVLARMILEYHGGKLEVNSEGEDRGTVVTMTFPVAKQPTA